MAIPLNVSLKALQGRARETLLVVMNVKVGFLAGIIHVMHEAERDRERERGRERVREREREGERERDREREGEREGDGGNGRLISGQ